MKYQSALVKYAYMVYSVNNKKIFVKPCYSAGGKKKEICFAQLPADLKELAIFKAHK